jgi:hypothetical protein
LVHGLVSCLWSDAEKIGGVAQIFIAVAAFVAIVIAVRQVNTSRELAAKATYEDFLKLALDHPYFDDPGERDLSGDNSYQRFVGILLSACDEIAWRYSGLVVCVFSPKLRAMWKRNIQEELKPHVSYLRSEKFEENGGWALFTVQLQSIWKEVDKISPTGGRIPAQH